MSNNIFKLEGFNKLQRQRMGFYLQKLVVETLWWEKRGAKLKEFLENKGIHLYEDDQGDAFLEPTGKKVTIRDGLFNADTGIHIFSAREFGWKNYRDYGAGRRGFFRADHNFIHELIHAIWFFEVLPPFLIKKVKRLYRIAGPEWFYFDHAKESAKEFLADQFPRALLFSETAHPNIMSLLEEQYFLDSQIPDIRLDKGDSGYE